VVLALAGAVVLRVIPIHWNSKPSGRSSFCLASPAGLSWDGLSQVRHSLDSSKPDVCGRSGFTHWWCTFRARL